MARTALPRVLRPHLAALRMLLVLTAVTGAGYPLLVTGIAQAGFADRANGSLLTTDQGRPVGSRLIGQEFPLPRHGPGGAARPDPAWFQPRPSAAGYDPARSGATDLGPTNPALTEAVRARRAAVAALDGVPPASVPADAVTASGSGLDPAISPAYAYQQAPRVGRARRLAPARVREVVARHVHGRALGFLGQPYVNVVELNQALADALRARG
ncbi:potassium-transporting ATPase subunit KdpC [Streptomyces sp. RS10V-4]|uniref:potassium-transporting ATPase subunit KdpC n=1 Tax=Streptomyces rhizoryzae TaxID=2932493 RepID=UPI00200440D5|nr:potassium-transporting ATPase subunit KdpC [Streptomyces rhizoryzae]MCK7622199.1 potassium-transporting ATPase subunit KdpC [Streptomyces rhizoryzae]